MEGLTEIAGMTEDIAGGDFAEWIKTVDVAGVDFVGVDSDGGNRRRWTMTEWITSS